MSKQRIRRTALALAAVAASAGLVAPAPSQASHTTDRIVVLSDRDGGYDLYLVDPHHGQFTRLTTDGATKGQPDMSPTGELVAYVEDGDIKVVSTSTGGVQAVTTTAEQESQPAWSPDGTQLVFVRRYPTKRSTEADLVIRRLSDNAETRVRLPGTEDAPDWSGAVGADHPIVFSSDTTGTKQLWRINAVEDPSNPSPFDPIQVTDHKNSSFYPAWSPDGTKLSLARWHEGKLGMALMIRDLRTGQETRLGLGAQDWGSSWSPDGTRIAYRHEEGKGSQAVQRLYWVPVDPSLGGPEPVPGQSGNNGNPSWGTMPTAAEPEPICLLPDPTPCL